MNKIQLQLKHINNEDKTYCIDFWDSIEQDKEAINDMAVALSLSDKFKSVKLKDESKDGITSFK